MNICKMRIIYILNLESPSNKPYNIHTFLVYIYTFTLIATKKTKDRPYNNKKNVYICTKK